MRTHHTIGVCAAAGSLVLGACQAWRSARDTVSDALRVEVVRAADDASTGRFDISAGALVRRHEAQADLDAARDALGSGAPAPAAAALRSAALFFAGHAAAPGAAAGPALDAAATALARLADEVDAGQPVPASAVVAASARANRAEAEHHRLAAARAWAQWQRSNTGDELVMAVDHLERALADEGRPVPAATRRALAEARDDACTLMRDAEVPPARVDESLAALGRAIATR